MEHSQQISIRIMSRVIRNNGMQRSKGNARLESKDMLRSKWVRGSKVPPESRMTKGERPNKGKPMSLTAMRQLIRRANTTSSKLRLTNIVMKLEHTESNGIISTIHSMRSTRRSQKRLEISGRSKA